MKLYHRFQLLKRRIVTKLLGGIRIAGELHRAQPRMPYGAIFSAIDAA